jgi:hypothetical protein
LKVATKKNSILLANNTKITIFAVGTGGTRPIGRNVC